MRKIERALFFFLLLPAVSFAQALPAAVCSTDSFYANFLPTAGIGFFALISLIALAYMAGEFFSHPKLLVWSRDEISQVLYSALILVLVSQILLSFCSINVSSALSLTSLSAVQTGSPLIPSQTVFQSAEATLAYLQVKSYSSFSDTREYIGDLETDLVYYEWESLGFGLLGGSGVTTSPYSGRQAMLGALGMFMNASMISLLTVISQISLYSFITVGGEVNNSFLPFFLICGVILRSIPFMRGLGGALIGIAISLCIFFPLLLLIEGMIWPPVYDSVIALYSLSDTAGGIIQRSSLAFLGGVFFSSLNFILIIAAIGQISGLLGQEVDASRLARLI